VTILFICAAIAEMCEVKEDIFHLMKAVKTLALPFMLFSLAFVALYALLARADPEFWKGGGVKICASFLVNYGWVHLFRFSMILAITLLLI